LFYFGFYFLNRELSRFDLRFSLVVRKLATILLRWWRDGRREWNILPSLQHRRKI